MAKERGLNFILPSISVFHSQDKNAFSNLLFGLDAYLCTFHGAQLYVRHQDELTICFLPIKKVQLVCWARMLRVGGIDCIKWSGVVVMETGR